jgi:MFS family permease
MHKLLRLPLTDRVLWKEFLAGLASIFLMAIGQGAFLILMVVFLEHRQVPVAENGLIKAFLSLVEGAACLAAGFLYRGKFTRRIMVAALLLMAAGSFLFAIQSLGVVMWLGTTLNGLGIGVMIVILYVATLERRPTALHLGLAIGLYTAGIAAGNALGEILSGIITDHYGFGTAFVFAGGAMLAVVGMVFFMGKQVNYSGGQHHPASGEPGGKQETMSAEQTTTKEWVWILAIAAGFTMSCVNVVFDTLFPVYGLRAGMTFTTLGSLAGLKMLLAALIRPFSGAITARLDTVRLNTWSLLGLAASTVFTPLVGIGAGLTFLVCLMGLSFGTVRVTSATLSLLGQNDPHRTSQRSSIYNTSLSVGQVLGPWVSGMVAGSLGLGVALTALPVLFIVFYLILWAVLPRLKLQYGIPGLGGPMHG